MLPSALTDLVNILEYITRQSGSLMAGRRFVGELRQKCRTLADLPGTLGRAWPELRADIRSAAFKGYVIFFRYVDERFEVVNIIEGHRDIDEFAGALDYQPRRSSLFTLGVVVVAGCLRHGFVSRLLHRFRKGNAAIGGFNQIT